ncbi:MAG: hypothetical protein M5U09_09310 [Gammaproteobacteria bacterium]|nr:hypothetical protein [Gammaproteobacteria bacterium]
MTAYHGSAQDIYLYTNQTDPELNAFFADLIETYQPGPRVGQLFVSVRLFGSCVVVESRLPRLLRVQAAYNQHNLQIHTANDTVATIGNSAAHAAKFARLAVAFMVEAGVDASIGGTVQFSAPTYLAGRGDRHRQPERQPHPAATRARPRCAAGRSPAARRFRETTTR